MQFHDEQPFLESTLLRNAINGGQCTVVVLPPDHCVHPFRDTYLRRETDNPSEANVGNGAHMTVRGQSISSTSTKWDTL